MSRLNYNLLWSSINWNFSFHFFSEQTTIVSVEFHMHAVVVVVEIIMLMNSLICKTVGCWKLDAFIYFFAGGWNCKTKTDEEIGYIFFLNTICCFNSYHATRRIFASSAVISSIGHNLCFFSFLLWRRRRRKCLLCCVCLVSECLIVLDRVQVLLIFSSNYIMSRSSPSDRMAASVRRTLAASLLLFLLLRPVTSNWM